MSRFLIAAALLAVNLPERAMAEAFDPPGRVARVKYLRGHVSFQPAGEPDWVAAVVNRPTTTGDRFWTDSGARAELSIGSATVRLAGTTGFSFLNLDDRTVQIELTQGTLGLRVLRLGRDEAFEVDTPNQAFTILRPGQYRVEASEDGQATFVTVRDGEGEATGAGRTYTVRSGQRATFSGVDWLRADIGNARGSDEFDNWGRGRDRRYDGSRSARYVSRDVVGYEDLDDYGSWRSDPSYGNVWVPTRVAVGWAPYRQGHWAWISPWGWTWVDEEPWGYAPYHYGRWVNVSGSWGWVPGPIAVQPVYAPALVAFIGGPGFGVSVSIGGGGGYAGNVGWFPLGPREVYVPAYHVSPAYVNRVNVSNTTVSSTTITTVYNTQVTNNYTSTNVTYVNRDVPGGVTAVPQAAFASAQPVARAAVAVDVQQVASAPVGARVAVAPTRDSVLGMNASTAGSAARPPPDIASRPVVARVAPPPPAVPFARQQEALAAHPGQPLARQEVEKLRPAERAAVPLVKQAPPEKPATPEASPPAGQPAAGQPAPPAAAQPSRPQPGTQPQPAAQPARPQPSAAPPGRSQEMRADWPPPAQPERQPVPGTQPQPAAQPARPQPSAAPPGRSQEMRADRPPPAQPERQPVPGTQPQPAAQPARPQPSAAPPGRSQEMRADRPPPAQPERQPVPGTQPQPAAQPARPQPSAAPPGRFQEMRADRPPSAQPERQPAPGTDAAGRPGPQADRPQQPRPQAAPAQNPGQTPAERAHRDQENR